MSEHEDKIRISEIFYSVQGEGLYVGVPSVFVRMFGCNFTCSGFSMPRGRLSRERFNVEPGKYKRYEDLPLVHTGCDSYASWDPRFKYLSPWLSYEEITDKIEDLLPKQRFSENKHLILTGGEPMLWQPKLPGLLNRLIDDLDLTHLTIETNGTQELTEEMRDVFWRLDEIVFSISAKLPCSGEPWEKAIKPEAVYSYWHHRRECIKYFKFVVGSEEDLVDVEKALKEYRSHGVFYPVYLMPAGGTTLHYDENKTWLVEKCKELGYRYSPRLQIDLFGNQWGT